MKHFRIHKKECPADSQNILETYEKESRTRSFDKASLLRLVYILCLFFTLYHLACASGWRTMQMVNIKHHAIHVGLVLGFALYPATRGSSRKTIAWYDWIFMGLSALMPIYVFWRYPTFLSTGFAGDAVDIVMGTILILLVLECSRRGRGPALSVLSVLFLAYVFSDGPFRGPSCTGAIPGTESSPS